MRRAARLTLLAIGVAAAIYGTARLTGERQAPTAVSPEPIATPTAAIPEPTATPTAAIPEPTATPTAARPTPSATVPTAGVVSLAADGSLSFARTGSTPRTLGNLGAEGDLAQRAALDGLRTELESLRDIESLNSELSDAVVGIDVDPTVPWGRVLWILNVAAFPPVRIHRLRLGLTETPGMHVLHDLGPVDGVRALWMRLTAEVLQPRTDVRPLARVSMALTNLNRGGWGDVGDDLEWRTSWASYGSVRREIEWMRRGHLADFVGLLDVPRPDRFLVTYREVFTVLRALADEGVASVLLLNADMTLPGDR